MWGSAEIRLSGAIYVYLDIDIFLYYITARYIDPGHQVLDVGCGPGDLSIRLSQRCREVRGVDVTPAMIRIAKEKAASGCVNVHFQQADACDLPFERHSFDTVMSVNALQTMSRPEEALSEMNRVLKPGGQFQQAQPNQNREGRWMWVLGLVQEKEMRYHHFAQAKHICSNSQTEPWFSPYSYQKGMDVRSANPESYYSNSDWENYVPILFFSKIENHAFSQDRVEQAVSKPGQSGLFH